MFRLTRVRLRQLNVDELNLLARWFTESYEAGWRPGWWKPAETGVLRQKLDEMREQQRIDNGDVPWV